MTSQERQWRLSQPRLSDKELLDIFPQAKRMYIKYIKDAMKENKISIRQKMNTLRELSGTPNWFMDYAKEDAIGPEIQKAQKIIKGYAFKLSALKNNICPKGITDEHVQQAKLIPFSTLIEINPNKKIRCPLHTDHTPSLHIYEKTNTWYCFSCNKGGDTIQFIMDTQKITFLDAVKFLCHL